MESQEEIRMRIKSASIARLDGVIVKLSARIAELEAAAQVQDEVVSAACRLLGYLQTGELYELGDVSTVASFVIDKKFAIDTK